MQVAHLPEDQLSLLAHLTLLLDYNSDYLIIQIAIDGKGGLKCLLYSLMVSRKGSVGYLDTCHGSL